MQDLWVICQTQLSLGLALVESFAGPEQEGLEGRCFSGQNWTSPVRGHDRGGGEEQKLARTATAKHCKLVGLKTRNEFSHSSGNLPTLTPPGQDPSWPR